MANINKINVNGTDYNITDTTSGYLKKAVTSIGITNGGGLSVSGSPVTSSGSITVGHTNSVTAQTTQGVYPIKIDAHGHISAYGSAVTIPTKTSDLTNDSGFITSVTVTEDTVFNISGTTFKIEVVS